MARCEDGVPTLIDWAGGPEAILRMINAFYDRVEHDDAFSAFFPGGVTVEHREHVAMWWTEVFGGPTHYADQLGGYQRMLAHHRGLNITADQRLRFATTMSQAADDAHLPDDPEFRAAPWSAASVGHPTGHGELAVGRHSPGHRPGAPTGVGALPLPTNPDVVDRASLGPDARDPRRGRSVLVRIGSRCREPVAVVGRSPHDADSLPPGSAVPTPSAQPTSTRLGPSATRRSPRQRGLRGRMARGRDGACSCRAWAPPGRPPGDLGPPVGACTAVSPSWSQTRLQPAHHVPGAPTGARSHRSRP